MIYNLFGLCAPFEKLRWGQRPPHHRRLNCVHNFTEYKAEVARGAPLPRSFPNGKSYPSKRYIILKGIYLGFRFIKNIREM